MKPIQLIAIEQYFHAVLFIILYKVVLTFASADVTIQIKAIEQYFHMIMLIMPYKVVLSVKIVVIQSLLWRDFVAVSSIPVLRSSWE